MLFGGIEGIKFCVCLGGFLGGLIQQWIFISSLLPVGSNLLKRRRRKRRWGAVNLLGNSARPKWGRRARLVISPRSISQLRDSISQTVAFDRLLPKSLLFLGKSFSLSSRKEEETNQMVSISHPKSSNRRRYFPYSYRLTGPKWNFPPPSCTSIHQQPIHLSKVRE
jgi:hypothetical protein